MFGGGRQRARYQGVNVDNGDEIDEPVARYLRTKLDLFLAIEGEHSAVLQSSSSKETQMRTGFEAEKEWTGIMGFSRDGSPWVGNVPTMPGVWISAGFSGHGK